MICNILNKIRKLIMSKYHLVTMIYNAEKTYFNKDNYNPNRKHRIVIFDCKIEELEYSYKFIKEDGREKSINRSMVVTIEDKKTPDNSNCFDIDIDEAF